MNRTIQCTVVALACITIGACGGPPSDAAPRDAARDTPAPRPAEAPDAPDPHPAPAPAPTPSVAREVASSFACDGIEPAWSLQVSPGTGWLRLPEGDTELAGTLKETSTGAYTWLGIPAHDPEQSVALLIVPDHCFPADGGAALPYSARLGLADGREAGGCCIPSPGD